MLINGSWHICDDGVVRPVIHAEVLQENGFWSNIHFLVDTGADRTVFSADLLDVLELDLRTKHQRLAGVGGNVESVATRTQVRFAASDESNVVFKGQFSAFTDPGALDMSVLGRDLLNLFAVIIDRLGDTVCLLWQGHGYSIEARG